jgi:hypothetical protein
MNLDREERPERCQFNGEVARLGRRTGGRYDAAMGSAGSVAGAPISTPLTTTHATVPPAVGGDARCEGQ